MEEYIQLLDSDIIKNNSVEDIHKCNLEIEKSAGNFFGLNFFHTNIRSISKNFDEFEVLLSLLKINFDFLILSETWQVTNPDLFSIDGYKIYYNNGNINQNDGVIIYVKENIYHNVKIVTENDFKFIRLEFNVKKFNAALTGIYRPPEYNVDLFLKIFDTYLSKYSKFEQEIIIGDINIDILNKSLIKNRYPNDYLNLLAKYNYISCINIPTRVFGTAVSCLDHIFIKSKVKNQDIFSFVLKSKLTDHYPVMLRINLTKMTRVKENSKSPKCIKYLNQDEFYKLINEKNFSTSNKDIDSEIENIIKIITEAMDESSYTKKINNKMLKRKPWITKGIIKSIQIRDKLYKQHLLNVDNIAIKNTYLSYKKTISELITKLKINYYRNKVLDYNNNPAQLWNILNESINNNKKRQGKIEHISCNNNELRSPNDIANKFNDHFLKISDKLAEKIVFNKNEQTEIINNIPINDKTFYLFPTDPTEVQETILSLNKNKSPGYDNITSNILQLISTKIAIPIAELFNKCFLKGYFPKCFKQSIIVPIFKAGLSSELNNYRPISLISTFAKIFEKLIYSRLYSFFEKSNILSNMQFGFLKGKSTSDAIATLTEYVYSSLDESLPCLTVFLDLTKAFDTVNHKLLLKKLKRYGIRGIPLTLLKSYINNRKQQVKINNRLSKEGTLSCGVPQGTILGPLFFIIYINDMLKLKLKGKILSYADDTALFVQAPNWTDVRRAVIHDLNLIKNWLDNNILTLNSSKSFFVSFSIHNTKQPPYEQLLIHDKSCSKDQDCKCSHIINKIDKYKYLGVMFDSYLKWDEQINSLTKRLRKYIVIFKKIRNFFDIKQLTTFYYALVESILTYGIIGWGGARETHISKLEIVHRMIIKSMLNKSKFFSSAEIFKISNLLNLKKLYLLQILKYIYKNNCQIEITNHLYNTRNKKNMKYFKAKKSITQHYYAFFVPKIYNGFIKYLTDNNVKINKQNFKKHARTWIENVNLTKIFQICI